MSVASILHVLPDAVPEKLFNVGGPRRFVPESVPPEDLHQDLRLTCSSVMSSGFQQRADAMDPVVVRCAAVSCGIRSSTFQIFAFC